MKTTHAIVCYTEQEDNTVVKYISTTCSQPTQSDIDNLRNQLAQDPDRGMTQEIDYQILILEAGRPDTDVYLKEFGVPEETEACDWWSSAHMVVPKHWLMPFYGLTI